jgi:hypothetical protein
MLIIDAARAVLIARSNDLKVRRQIAALRGSLDAPFSYEQILEELKALRAGRPTLGVIVDGSTAKTRVSHQSGPASRLWRRLPRNYKSRPRVTRLDALHVFQLWIQTVAQSRLPTRIATTKAFRCAFGHGSSDRANGAIERSN